MKHRNFFINIETLFKTSLLFYKLLIFILNHHLNNKGEVEWKHLVQKMEHNDVKEVLNIYKEGIDTKMATFETNLPSEQVWDEKHHATLRFVAEE